MTAPGDAAPLDSSVGKPLAVFVMGNASVGSVSQVNVFAQPASSSYRRVSVDHDESHVQSGGHASIGAEQSYDGIQSTEKEGPPMTTNTGWSTFLKSPHFTVITTGAVVLVAGLGMFTLLDGKISSLRLETKSDLQLAAQKADNQFSRVDTRFDRVDSKFDAVISKIDADGKELRSLLQASKP